MRGLFNIDGPLMSGLGKMCDLLWLNVLALVCAIPIVTAGASFTALYYMTMKMSKNEEGYITRGFFKSFKENFKQSTILWMIMLVIAVVFWADYRIYTYAQIDFPKIAVIAFYILLIIFVLAAIYIFPLQARFVNTCKGTLKNAFLLSITQLPKTVLMIIIYVLPFILLWFFPIALPLNLMFGISLPAYISSYVLVSIFKKIEEGNMNENKEETEIKESGEDVLDDISKP